MPTTQSDRGIFQLRFPLLRCVKLIKRKKKSWQQSSQSSNTFEEQRLFTTIQRAWQKTLNFLFCSWLSLLVLKAYLVWGASLLPCRIPEVYVICFQVILHTVGGHVVETLLGKWEGVCNQMTSAKCTTICVYVSVWRDRGREGGQRTTFEQFEKFFSQLPISTDTVSEHAQAFMFWTANLLQSLRTLLSLLLIPSIAPVPE